MIRNEIELPGQEGKPIFLDQTISGNGGSKGVVVFCHGFKGFKDWGHFNKVSEMFANAGFVFVKFNFSHNGTSPESPSDFVDLEAFGNNNFTKELNDLGMVMDWVGNNECSKGKDLPIYLLGHSRGGGIAILKANEDHRVGKLVSWAAVGDFENRFVGDIEKFRKDGVYYILNGRTKQQMPLYYQFYEDFMANKIRLDIPKAAKNIDIPFLIIHGKRDEAVPVDDAVALHQYNKRSQIMLLEDAGHTFGAMHPFEGSELPRHALQAVEASIKFLSD